MKFAAVPVLVLLGALSGGCVYVPGPALTDTDQKANLPNPSGASGFLGTRDSHKPVRPGASRNQIRAYLGNPDMLNDTGTTEVYRLYVHLGWVWSFLPGHLAGNWTHSISTEWALLIGYDRKGITDSWQQTRPDNVDWQTLHSFYAPASAPAESRPSEPDPKLLLHTRTTRAEALAALRWPSNRPTTFSGLLLSTGTVDLRGPPAYPDKEVVLVIHKDGDEWLLDRWTVTPLPTSH